MVETNEYFLPLTVREREKLPLSSLSAEKLPGDRLLQLGGIVDAQRARCSVMLPVSGENALPA